MERCRGVKNKKEKKKLKMKIKKKKKKKEIRGLVRQRIERT